MINMNITKNNIIGFLSICILLACAFTFIPICILIIEYMIEGKNSILQKMLDNIIV